MAGGGGRTARGCTLARVVVSNGLAAQPQGGDEGLIASFIGGFEMIAQRASLRDQLQEAATGMIVLLVGPEVSGEIGDPLGENGHLDFGGTGVARRTGVRIDQFGLAYGCDRHRGLFRSSEIKNT